MQTLRPKLRIENSGYYFIGLLLLAFLGFWPSYFSRFFNGTADSFSYFHLHAILAMLWVVTLVVQPLLIRNKQLQLHRVLGKCTYVLFPLLCLSILLVIHSRHTVDEMNLGLNLLVPFKDLLIFITLYLIAIRYKHNYHIHARAMVATGLVFIEPSLVRLISNAVVGFSAAYPLTIAILYALIVGIILVERKQKKARWVFPMVLCLLIPAHTAILLGISLPPWEFFAQWFMRLPLT